MNNNLPLPAYDMVVKCSHIFNLLDARGAISVTERAGYIARVRKLAKDVARSFYNTRKQSGFKLAEVNCLKHFLGQEEFQEVIKNRDI